MSSGQILAMSKLKPFADDKINVTQNIKLVFHRVENLVGNRVNLSEVHWVVKNKFTSAKGLNCVFLPHFTLNLVNDMSGLISEWTTTDHGVLYHFDFLFTRNMKRISAPNPQTQLLGI